MTVLSESEKTRYERQMAVSGWKEDSQAKLKETTVFVAGTGGQGAPIVQQLALLGVGRIRVGDIDVRESADGLEELVAGLNPDVELEVVENKITMESFYGFMNDPAAVDDLIGDADAVVDGAERIDTKFPIADAARRKGIPYLFHGTADLNAFACVFHPPHTPCFHCLYNVTMLDAVREKVGKVKRRPTIPHTSPPLFLSSAFVANEALKVLLGVGEPAYNRFFLFLQRGDESIYRTVTFWGMSEWTTEYLRRVSAEQGFDWKNPWRGNFVEELRVGRNAECAYCS